MRMWKAILFLSLVAGLAVVPSANASHNHDYPRSSTYSGCTPDYCVPAYPYGGYGFYPRRNRRFSMVIGFGGGSLFLGWGSGYRLRPLYPSYGGWGGGYGGYGGGWGGSGSGWPVIYY